MSELERLKDARINESQLVELRSGRTHRLQEWHERVNKVDALYRGDWTVVFPGEASETDLPHVMNLVQVTLEDIDRLVSEARPSVKCYPASDNEEAQKNAYLREGVAFTYGEVNNWDVVRPRLAMDLAGTGAAFVAITKDPKSLYPSWHRIDPRFAFPDTHNGVLQDLLVAQSMKLRQAARLFPQLGLEQYDDPNKVDSCEIVEYYDDHEAVQGVLLMHAGQPVKGGVFITKRWEHGLGVVPVAFAQLDSFDGDFRGMFDQITGSLATKNRIVKLVLDYTDQQVYAPIVSKGLMNPDEALGPMAHFRLDPNVPDAQLGRLVPAGSSPQLFALLEYLEREQRGGVSYPAARQGEVSQSIASASFVASTQGSLTSVVRNLQRLLSFVQEQANVVSFKLDERYLNETKPLAMPVGPKKTYKPSSTIDGQYLNTVIYGAGGGLDRMNADVRVLQHLSAGLISRETAREQIEYLPQDGEENDRIEREMAGSALAQKFLTEAPWDLVAQVYARMDDGRSLAEAIKDVMAQQQQQQEQQQPTSPTLEAEAQTPGPKPTPDSPMEEQLALQKGGGQAGAGPAPAGPAGAGPQAEPTFQGPPIQQVLVRPTGG